MNNQEEPVYLKNADEAASVVLSQAMEADQQGTFAVGGCIIENNSGKLIHKMHNNVLKPLKNTSRGFTYDPTAHGERQLVYWYYENKDKLNLPEPEDLTIVTSLDPCAMCTGALLTAGFNVGVIAIDDFAGINYNTAKDKFFKFDALPANLRSLARSKFGYYACGNKNRDPDKYVREYIGGSKVAFKESAVSAEKFMGCGAVFAANAGNVRTNSSEAGLTPGELKDPAELPENSVIKQKYREIYPEAFKLKIPYPRLPNQELYNVLTHTNGNARNSVAFIDPFGNVVLCMADSLLKSPVQTAFMNVTRQYAITRYNLMNYDEKTRSDATQYLTHPKYGTFVFLYAPDPDETTTIMNLGAYGSTMEGPVPQLFPVNFQYYHPPQTGTVQELALVIMNLPPFYTQLVQLSAGKTAVDIS